jgi:hypothetical protein
LYILELTVEFETNLKTNSDRKHEKYLTLITYQENIYDEVKFVNVSISSLGVFGESTNTLFDMLHDLKYDKQRIKYVKKKIIATCIRTSYYIQIMSILTDAIYRKHKECNGIKRIVQLHSQRVQWNVFHCTLGKWNFLFNIT